MRINSDKDGVLALTRKSFDNEIRALYRIEDIMPRNLPNYELLGHYVDSSELTAAYFRKLTGRDDEFDFSRYLSEYCTFLQKIGIWRKFPYNGAILSLIFNCDTILSISFCENLLALFMILSTAP